MSDFGKKMEWSTANLFFVTTLLGHDDAVLFGDSQLALPLRGVVGFDKPELGSESEGGGGGLVLGATWISGSGRLSSCAASSSASDSLCEFLLNSIAVTLFRFSSSMEGSAAFLEGGLLAAGSFAPLGPLRPESFLRSSASSPRGSLGFCNKEGKDPSRSA